MSIRSRNNVYLSGTGPVSIVFAHGFGCDQTMWRFLAPAFATRFRVVLYDLVGSGGSDLNAYDRRKYATLHGHAVDLLEIIDSCTHGPVVFVGHSVSAMIGLLATIRAPSRFVAQVMVGPSPCFINDGDYIGGFNREDIEELLQTMEENFLAWATMMAPTIMRAPRHPELSRALTASFLQADHAILKHFARVTFLADHRADLPYSKVPALILQCSDDMMVPREVGNYLRDHLPDCTLDLIDNVGHCPHVSAPTRTSRVIDEYLARRLR